MRDLAIAAARAGGEVLLRRYRNFGEIIHKGTIDLVTAADRESEEAIVSLLRSESPDCDILAEEGDYVKRCRPRCWIIDPLDGTTNFAHGFPWFAVSIALEEEGEVVCGVVFDPINDRLFVAEKGKGSTMNGSPMQVSTTPDLNSSLLATGFPYDRRTSAANNFNNFVNLKRLTHGVRRAGVASLDLAYTAYGAFDGYWEMKLKPWDVAAGALLVTEAGGTISRFDGSLLDIYGDQYLATNGLVHEELIDALRTGVIPE